MEFVCQLDFLQCISTFAFIKCPRKYVYSVHQIISEEQVFDMQDESGISEPDSVTLILK